jgi:hypothetical protein
MTTDEMLENQTTVKLAWSDPREALNHYGEPFTACVDHTATVYDCIGYSRCALSEAFDKRPQELSDRVCLEQFIAVHWAYPVETEGTQETPNEDLPVPWPTQRGYLPTQDDKSPED